MNFVTEAFAMGAPQGAAGANPSGMEMLMQFFPLILMFVIFYFLLIRPQQRRQKEHKKLLEELKKGDYIYTQAGFFGRIVDLDDETVSFECGTATLRMGRGSVANVVDKDGHAIAVAAPAKKSK